MWFQGSKGFDSMQPFYTYFLLGGGGGGGGLSNRIDCRMLKGLVG